MPNKNKTQSVASTDDTAEKEPVATAAVSGLEMPTQPKQEAPPVDYTELRQQMKDLTPGEKRAGLEAMKESKRQIMMLKKEMLNEQNPERRKQLAGFIKTLEEGLPN